MKTIKLMMITVLICFGAFKGLSQDLPSANGIIKKVNARDEGAYVTQKFTMELIDRRGKKQFRETVSYRKDYQGERKTVLFFSSPTNVKGTGFLTFDYHDGNKDDDQWLYLPALRKTRRISAANRGDYFLGTDLTYEDIKKGTKINTEDYTFKTLKEDKVGSTQCYVVEAIPVNGKIAKELKYGKVHFYIDPEKWISVKNEYWDIAGNPLKTTEIKALELVDGIWTVQQIDAVNHKTSHRSVLVFSDSDYQTALEDDLFVEQALLRGHR